MIRVKIIPEAPTSAPAMIKPLLESTNPVAAAATPEYELSSEITTGMSAPPIGITSMTPSSEAVTTKAQYAKDADGSTTSHPASARQASPSNPFQS